jgi:hypothetical protein
MVLIWNDLACGDRDAAAVLVALNSVFQIAACALLGYFYLTLLPRWLGLAEQALPVSLWEIARAVLVFLGIPLLAGWVSRTWGERARGTVWYEQRFLPRVGPLALYGLLGTVVLLFALQGEAITSPPVDVVRIAVPLLAYFTLMWGVAFAAGLRLGLGYERNATVAFTRRQQLRARDRGGDRRVRRHLRPGARRRRRTPDRGARPGRPRVRRPGRAQALLPTGSGDRMKDKPRRVAAPRAAAESLATVRRRRGAAGVRPHRP